MDIENAQRDGESTDTRGRILLAASRLIAEGGSEAATTRAVATAAGIQAPTIYRIFGDKEGLLAATAEYELARYIAAKGSLPPLPDPVDDLKLGWDRHIAFCLSNPGLFPILSGEPLSSRSGSATNTGIQILRRRIRRIAEAGRLTTTEKRATATVHAAGTGVIATLLAQSENQRDQGLSAFTRDMVIDAITRPPGEKAERRPQAAATELKSNLDTFDTLTAGERHLLGELLERIALSDQ